MGNVLRFLGVLLLWMGLARAGDWPAPVYKDVAFSSRMDAEANAPKGLKASLLAGLEPTNFQGSLRPGVLLFPALHANGNGFVLHFGAPLRLFTSTGAVVERGSFNQWQDFSKVVEELSYRDGAHKIFLGTASELLLGHGALVLDYSNRLLRERSHASLFATGQWSAYDYEILTVPAAPTPFGALVFNVEPLRALGVKGGRFAEKLRTGVQFAYAGAAPKGLLSDGSGTVVYQKKSDHFVADGTTALGFAGFTADLLLQPHLLHMFKPYVDLNAATTRGLGVHLGLLQEHVVFVETGVRLKGRIEARYLHGAYLPNFFDYGFDLASQDYFFDGSATKYAYLKSLQGKSTWSSLFEGVADLQRFGSLAIRYENLGAYGRSGFTGSVESKPIAGLRGSASLKTPVQCGWEKDFLLASLSLRYALRKELMATVAYNRFLRVDSREDAPQSAMAQAGFVGLSASLD